jgi:signal transduction histidine kinase
MNGNECFTGDTTLTEECSFPAIVQDEKKRVPRGRAISRNQNFILNNIGILASSVFRTSLAIQRYATIIEEQQNRLNAIMAGIEDGLLLLEHDGTPIVQNDIGRKYIDQLCRCDGHGKKCLIHDTLKRFVRGSSDKLTRNATRDGRTYRLTFRRIEQANAPDRVSLRVLASRNGKHKRHESSELHGHSIVREMAAAIAHEINNPLTPIIGLSSPSLYDNTDPTGLEEELKTIHRAGGRIANIIHLLLNFDEVYRWKTAGPVRLKTMIRDIAEQSRREIKGKKVHLKTRLAASVPNVHGNEAQLRQMVNFLIRSIVLNTIDPELESRIILSTGVVGDSAVLRINYTNADLYRSIATDRTAKSSEVIEAFRDLHLLLAEMLARSIQLKIRYTNSADKHGGTITIHFPEWSAPVSS